MKQSIHCFMSNKSKHSIADFKMMPSRILVTGGTGLVGNAVKDVVQLPEMKRDNEEWFFVGSEEANLTYVLPAYRHVT